MGREGEKLDAGDRPKSGREGGRLGDGGRLLNGRNGGELLGAKGRTGEPAFGFRRVVGFGWFGLDGALGVLVRSDPVGGFCRG